MFITVTQSAICDILGSLIDWWNIQIKTDASKSNQKTRYNLGTQLEIFIITWPSAPKGRQYYCLPFVALGTLVDSRKGKRKLLPHVRPVQFLHNNNATFFTILLHDILQLSTCTAVDFSPIIHHLTVFIPSNRHSDPFIITPTMITFSQTRSLQALFGNSKPSMIQAIDSRNMVSKSINSIEKKSDRMESQLVYIHSHKNWQTHKLNHDLSLSSWWGWQNHK